MCVSCSRSPHAYSRGDFKLTHITQNRSKLLLGTGCIAMAMGMMFSADRAEAQAINATETFVQGSGNRILNGRGSETIEIDTPVAVIDWTPTEDGAGNALDFLPTGTVVTYENSPSNLGSFAVLNRILPATNNNVAVIDGTVVSQLRDAMGATTPGGTVAFYSPTGLLIGGNASFDVGNLILTTLDIDLASFDAFAQSGGTLSLALGPNGPQSITINPGASFTASEENSYFVVTAAQIEMFGTTNINGTQAFVAGDEVMLTLNNGLFDIQVPVGTASATPINIDGNVGGPSSTGVTGDNHLIYAVAAAQNDPISLLFSGNLGFQPAASAGIVNGEIIISANYNVFGRSVEGGQVDLGIGQQIFPGFSGGALNDTAVNVTLNDFAATSTILAASSDTLTASASAAGSFVDGDLLLFAENSVNVTANNGQDFSITGGLLASANDSGETGLGVVDPLDSNAAAGNVMIEALGGATLSIAGSVEGQAITRAGNAEAFELVGSEQGGIVDLRSDGGTINIGGDVTLDAGALNGGFGFTTGVNLRSGGDSIGGTATLGALNNGAVVIDGSATVRSNVIGNTLTNENDGVGTNAIAGIASVVAASGGDISVGAGLTVEANGEGGLNQGGVGGTGGTGGNGFGGVATVVANVGTISVGTNAIVFASGLGGSAGVFNPSDGMGGNGTGGRAQVSAEGTLTEIGEVSINGFASLNANGNGGTGGAGDGSVIGPGVGGDGFAGSDIISVAVDPTQTGGAFLTAGVDNGRLTVGGNSNVEAIGFGGDGGAAGTGQDGGAAGNGFGGRSQAGLVFLGGGNGSVAQGFANLASLDMRADAFGGAGGAPGTAGALRGDGGNATGGSAELTVEGGDLTATTLSLFSDGTGGAGANGGDGTAGQSSAFTSGGSTVALQSAILRSSGFGESGEDGDGGDAVGGLTQWILGESNVQISAQTDLQAFANGGSGSNGAGGNATGGTVQLDTNDPASVFNTATNLTISSNATAGAGFSGTDGATAQGGASNIFADAGGSVTASQILITSDAFGGANSGAGNGGIANGGSTQIVVADDGSLTTTVGDISIGAGSVGGSASGGGAGGNATGGLASLVTGLEPGSVGTVSAATFINATAGASGGNGIGGGNAAAGIAQVAVLSGMIDVQTDVFVQANAFGGSSFSLTGFGGDGGIGTGGLAVAQALGADGRFATINVGGNVSVNADGFGGSGGIGDGSLIAAGNGGDGFGGSSRTVSPITPDQTNGAFFLIGDQNSSLNVTGISSVRAVGSGGIGGSGGIDQAGGDGGNGSGGNAFFGNSGLNTDDADDLNDGTSVATLGELRLENSGIGGNGGAGGSTFDPLGNGGTGSAGVTEINVSLDQASVIASGVTLNIGDLTALSNGIGGAGDIGGAGFGGVSSVSAVSGGEVNLLSVNAQSNGTGGSGRIGGDGNGGGAADPGQVNGGTGIGFRNGTIAITGDASFSASGFGGASTGGDGGAGNGGFATFANSFLFQTDLQGDLTIGGFASLLAEGIGGEGGTGFTGGDGTGGLARLTAAVGGTILLDSAQIAAGGQGGTGSGTAGGNGIGGEATIISRDAGSDVTITNAFDFSSNTASTSQFSLISANGIGGLATGASGIGGDGIGGTTILAASAQGSISLPLAPSTGFNRILARGFGGSSSVDGGAGGFGRAGTGLILVDGGAQFSTGATLFSVFALGGSSTEAFNDVQTINVDGGDAEGGDRRITVTGGSTLTGEFAGGTAGGLGGDGSGTGNGGSGTGGVGVYTFEDSTFNAVGSNSFGGGGGGGGRGNVGGDGSGGNGVFTVSNSTINLISTGQISNETGQPVTPTLRIFSQNLAGDGVVQGGNASGGTIDVSITNSSITGGTFAVNNFAQGGVADQAIGTGGNAASGSISVNATDSTFEIQNGEDIRGLTFDPATGMQVPGDIIPGSINEIVSFAQAGGGLNSGNATSGNVSASFTGGSVTINSSSTADGVLDIASVATSGDAADRLGVSVSGEVSASFTDTPISGDIVNVSSDASSEAVQPDAILGVAVSGSASLSLLGSSTTVLNELNVEALATTTLTGQADGGFASLLISGTGNQSGPQVSVDSLRLDASGVGGTPNGSNNRHGRFALNVINSQLTTREAVLNASGDTFASGEIGPSVINANGGTFDVEETLSVDAFANLTVNTANGGTIGDRDTTNPATQIAITTQNTALFSGDDDTRIGLFGAALNLSSSDIIINQGARFGANEVILNSLNNQDTAVLGGAGTPGGVVLGQGYTLIGEELDRIEAGRFTFNQNAIPIAQNNNALSPGTQGSQAIGPEAPSLIVRDYLGSGSAGDGLSNITLNVIGTGGILRVEGQAGLTDADANDSISLSAQRRIEIVTPGSISVTDPDGNPIGALSLASANIWAADAATITQLQNDPDFDGRNDLLSTAAPGSDNPLGYIRAGEVTINFDDTLLVRNTGTNEAQGGILVGEGGLFIANETDTGGDIFAYGSRFDASTGEVVTGEIFYNEVEFFTGSSTSAGFTDESAFNDCFINTGVCLVRTSEPEGPSEEEEIVRQEAAQANNASTVEAAVQAVAKVAASEEESNEDFGMDFPSFVETEEVEDEGDVDDPVASGGDASLYGRNGNGNGNVEVGGTSDEQ